MPSQLWECFDDSGQSTPTDPPVPLVLNCSYEVVLVWNVVTDNGPSEDQQRAFFLYQLEFLRDKMQSGCVKVGLIKYGSCAYIRHELSYDYNSVLAQIMYVEGVLPSVDSVGLGDGYSNLLAAYYQIYQVLNNPTTSSPGGTSWPNERYKKVIMSINDVWGLDWDANYPPAAGRVYTSGAADGTTGNPGFTASQPDDRQILYEATTYPAPTYYMNPMSWFSTNPAPLKSTAPWDGTYTGGTNMVAWDLAPLNCEPDMGLAQTWFQDNLIKTLNGQKDNWPGPWFNSLNNPACSNCYTYPNPSPRVPDPLEEYPNLPSSINQGDVFYFVMNGAMDRIITQYNTLYGNSYVQSNSTIPGPNWPPTVPLANSYFENTYLIPNQCGTHYQDGGIFLATSITGDGIYLPDGDFGDNTDGQWFQERICSVAMAGTPVEWEQMPTTFLGHNYNGSIHTGDPECPRPTGSGEFGCPEGYELIYYNGEWQCCLTEITEPILQDTYLPIDLDDEFYFRDISWTVSYDPKAKAWISFHDWHPELCLPSINHFMTTKTQTKDEPECPAGYTYNETLQLCELLLEDEVLAQQIMEEAVPTIVTGAAECQGGDLKFPDGTFSDVDDLVDLWTRFCFSGNQEVRIRNIGTSSYSPIIWAASGLKPDGTIDNVSQLLTVGTQDLENYFCNTPVISGAAGTSIFGSGHQYLGSFGKNSDCALVDWDGYTPGNPVNPPYADMSVLGEGSNVGPSNRGGFHNAGIPDEPPNNVSEPYSPNEGGGQNSPTLYDYYFNTDIQKYVIVEPIKGTKQAADNRWVTFNPSVMVPPDGALGDPSASQELTTTSNWKIINVGANQFTVDPTDNFKVKDAATLLPTLAQSGYNKMIECMNNSARHNGFYSKCSFGDYEHEITLGSTGDDDDEIGVIIAAFQDDTPDPNNTSMGQYGPLGQTYTLSLVFGMDVGSCSLGSGKTSSNSVRILYNVGQDVYAFSNYAANPSLPPTDVTTEVLSWCLNPFHSTPGQVPYTSGNYPHGPGNNYRQRGFVRVRIKKTNSRVQVWCTQSMGDTGGLQTGTSVNVGNNNPFTSFRDSTQIGLAPNEEGGNNDRATIFDFDLIDPFKDYLGDAGSPGYSTPWDITDSSNTTSYKNYAVGDELEKFVDFGRVGYFTHSQNNTQFFHIDFIGDQVASGSCDCPEGFTKVYKDLDGFFTEQSGECTEGNIICRKISCPCPPSPVPAPWVTSGDCDDLFGVGHPNYVNEDPRICGYSYLEQLPPTLIFGSIWKHNQRCDSFVNYYGVDYPWEIEFVETTGQAVNTVRSLEYQLESYVYKGNDLNEWNCGDDRWSDLDWNFDEAIIYNIEQVSGLLKLNLNPKGDPITALQYPIIGTTDIQILYTKEEQKYRLNQFWDITKDRGEFTNVQQQIWITHLNGYIRDLNSANLNYGKFPTQRKKFRSYYNRVILRRVVSGNRKMLLKLVNTKLNLSFR